jgi:internalin A
MKLAHINLSSSKMRFLITGMMMFLPFLSSIASAAPQQPQPKSFEAWCRQRKSVPVATRHTIDILIKKAGTKNCKLADRQLKTLTDLDLDRNEISDLKPLAGLTKLTTLYLGSNQISDMKPLAGLTNLNYLWLGGNQIAVKVCPVKPASICKF